MFFFCWKKTLKHFQNDYRHAFFYISMSEKKILLLILRSITIFRPTTGSWSYLSTQSMRDGNNFLRIKVKSYVESFAILGSVQILEINHEARWFARSSRTRNRSSCSISLFPRKLSKWIYWSWHVSLRFYTFLQVFYRFFVLSGFLMAMIIGTKPITCDSVYQFYFRRSKRILPLYLFIVFVGQLKPCISF